MIYEVSIPVLGSILAAATGIDPLYVVMGLQALILGRLLMTPTRGESKELVRLGILEHDNNKKNQTKDK